MQIFVKCLTGHTATIDVEPQDKVETVMRRLEQRGHAPSVPRQRLLFQGKQLTPEDTLASIPVLKEATLHLLLRLSQQIFVQWCGEWLRSKEADSASYENFFHILTCKNVVTIRDQQSGTIRTESSMINLTAYHMKKVLAKFLALEPHEIDIAFYAEEADFEWLPDDFLLAVEWRHMGRDFVARPALRK